MGERYCVLDLFTDVVVELGRYFWLQGKNKSST